MRKTFEGTGLGMGTTFGQRTEVKELRNGPRQVDPICGSRVEAAGPYSAEYKRRRYWFCSEQCQQAFHRQSERFRLADLARSGALLSPGRVRWALG